METKSIRICSMILTAMLAVLVLAGTANAASNAEDKRPASVLVPEQAMNRAHSSEPSGAETERLIAHTTSIADKAHFKLLGCDIVNELDDATAVECPKGVKLKDAEPDELLYITDLGADTQINANGVWSLGYTGSGATVAVLDTGVDYTHPELSGSIAGGKSFVKYTRSYYDDQGHGTHVSGIITADGVGGTPTGYAKGVAPAAKVWMGKVCDRKGSCWSSDIAKGIDYVVQGPDKIINSGDEPAKILSISIGGGAYLDDCDGTYLAQKVNWAADNGVSVVVAAGNSASGVSSPGCASKAITVGAVNKTDALAYFSGRGASMTKHGIVAPGVAIYSTLPGNSYASWSGTSMATPHVAATIALMKQKNSSLDAAAIKSKLFGAAVCLTGSGTCPNSNIGYGRIDALAAVNAA